MMGMSETIETRALRWAAGHDTGTSSKAILAVMTGNKPRDWYCYPHDGDDLGRCVRLLDMIPEWRPRIGEMAAVGNEWAALAERWADLEKLHRAEDWKGMSALIQKLVRPHEDKRSNHIRLGEGMSVVFGDK
jgi:hypothetical protein